MKASAAFPAASAEAFGQPREPPLFGAALPITRTSHLPRSPGLRASAHAEFDQKPSPGTPETEPYWHSPKRKYRAPLNPLTERTTQYRLANGAPAEFDFRPVIPISGWPSFLLCHHAVRSEQIARPRANIQFLAGRRRGYHLNLP